YKRQHQELQLRNLNRKARTRLRTGQAGPGRARPLAGMSLPRGSSLAVLFLHAAPSPAIFPSFCQFVPGPEDKVRTVLTWFRTGRYLHGCSVSVMAFPEKAVEGRGGLTFVKDRGTGSANPVLSAWNLPQSAARRRRTFGACKWPVEVARPLPAGEVD